MAQMKTPQETQKPLPAHIRRHIAAKNANNASAAEKVRTRQWVYLGPILAAPLAHMAVSMYRKAKTPMQKRLVIGVGVVGSTCLSLGMRLYLMHHAGYAGAPSGTEIDSRVKVVDADEKDRILNPGMWDIFREALRGFG